MDLKQCSDEELIVRYRDGDTEAMDLYLNGINIWYVKKQKPCF